MAGEWIKVEATTPDKPEIMRVARELGMEWDAVFGKLVRLWAWFDKNSVDGVVDGIVAEDVDALVSADGFASALERVNWLEVDDDAERVYLPNFDRHNGETAKQRALKNKRQAKYRQGCDANVDGQASTEASTREEKRREEKKKPKPASEHPLFDYWYQHYPAKKGRGQAAKAFAKIDPDQELADRMIQAIHDQQKEREWKQAAGEFVPQWPNPATWLNGERWLDEVQPRPAKSSDGPQRKKLD